MQERRDKDRVLARTHAHAHVPAQELPDPGDRFPALVRDPVPFRILDLDLVPALFALALVRSTRGLGRAVAPTPDHSRHCQRRDHRTGPCPEADP